MNTQKLLISLLSILFVNQIGLPEEELAQELSNTRYASVEVYIVSDPKIFRVGSEKVIHIINNSELFEAVWQEVIGVGHWDNYMSVPFVNQFDEAAGMQIVRFGLVLTLPEECKPAAKEFLQAYIKELRTALRKEYEVSEKLNERKLILYASRRDHTERYLQDLLERQSKIAEGKGPLDKESVRQRILEHERAIIENDLQHQILEKRAQELSEQIAIMKTEKAEVVNQDEITQNLKMLIEKFEADLFKYEKEIKENPDTILMDLTGLKERIVTLKLQLAERAQQVQRQAAENIQELKRQLGETTMQLAELKIQEPILHSYSPGKISDSIEYEMLEVKIEAAKENLRRAIMEMDEASLEVDLLQPPTVSYDKIISSETVPEDN